MLMLWKFVIINSDVRFNNLSMIKTLQKCESVPKVSVIIPVYNVEKYIKRCIESVLSQTLQDFEIIIVNDYTPDKSMDVIEDYIKNDSRIVSVNNYSNMGLMWTRREGYKIAKGEYFYFLDSDDFIPRDALEKVYNKAVEEDADIVFGNFQYVDNDGTKGKIHTGHKRKVFIKLCSHFNYCIVCGRSCTHEGYLTIINMIHSPIKQMLKIAY